MQPVSAELDRRLVQAASAGDAEQFAALAQEVQPALERCAALLTGDLDEARSIAQEVVMRATQQLSNHDPTRPVYPWLRGIAVNLSRQFLDRRRRHARPADPAVLVDVPQASGQHQGVLSEILRDELFTRLWLAIGQLPEALREALVLHHIEGLEYAEIATLTGASSESLRTRASRARTLLRTSLGPVVDTWMTQS